MTVDLQAMTRDVAQNRKEIIERMSNFSLTDTILFRNPDAEDLFKAQCQIWDPILHWAKEQMNADLKPSQSLEVPEENNASLPRLQAFLNSLSDKELAAFYEVSKITKSVLLGAAMVKKRVSAEDAFKAAFLEELWQAEKWGHDEEAEERRATIKQELLDVEKFLAA